MFAEQDLQAGKIMKVGTFSVVIWSNMFSPSSAGRQGTS